MCTVGAGARVGEDVVLHAQVALGRDVRLGTGSELFPMVVVYDGVQIGERCLIHAGCVLGSDGHGFEPSAQGWVKIPHTGTVVVEDEVEIGANTTIDRGRFGATRIGRGAKIDNLVQLGHNVIVGEGAMIVAQVGIAGSAVIGARAVLGGQVGVGGHVRLGDRVQVGGQSGVFGDVPAGEIVLGHPARPRTEALRNMAQAARVPGLVEKLRRLEGRVAELERERSVSKEGSA
jgi:UDP-3-O-[3-hydroxymyristoyl] glucosamine N-acyltransferase